MTTGVLQVEMGWWRCARLGSRAGLAILLAVVALTGCSRPVEWKGRGLTLVLYDRNRALPTPGSEAPAALVVALGHGDNHACALAFDGQFMYVGLNLDPKVTRTDGSARIAKVDAATLQPMATLELPAGVHGTRVHALTLAGTALVHGSYTNPAMLTKIDTRSMKPTAAVTASGKTSPSQAFVRPMISLGAYTYIGLDTVPGKLLKVDSQTMDIVADLTLPNGFNNVFSLTSDGASVFAGLETRPGKVVRINPETMKMEDSTTLARGEDYVYTLAYSQGSVFAITHTDPLRVVKLSTGGLTRMGAVRGMKGDSYSRAAVSDGKSLFVGTWTAPARILRIDIETMRVISSVILEGGDYPSSLILDGADILASFDMVPGRVGRIRNMANPSR